MYYGYLMGGGGTQPEAEPALHLVGYPSLLHALSALNHPFHHYGTVKLWVILRTTTINSGKHFSHDVLLTTFFDKNDYYCVISQSQ